MYTVTAGTQAATNKDLKQYTTPCNDCCYYYLANGKVKCKYLCVRVRYLVEFTITHNVTPVSYTHLDVYKRQGLHALYQFMTL